MAARQLHEKDVPLDGGGFVMPDEYRDESLGSPDDRIHKCSPGPERKNMRSKTPMGFSIAVQRSNGRDLNLNVA